MKLECRILSKCFKWYFHHSCTTYFNELLIVNANYEQLRGHRTVCRSLYRLSPSKCITYCSDAKTEGKKTVFNGPDLKHFLMGQIKQLDSSPLAIEEIPYVEPHTLNGRQQKVFIDVYGCQMNVSDTQVAWAVLKSAGYVEAARLEEADVVLLMTCAIREGAESKVWNKLDYLRGLKNKRRNQPLKIGVLGCMAERLKEQLLEAGCGVDLVAGPDSYKDLPRMLALTYNDQTAINVLLSLDETYADVVPVRLNQDSVTAFVSIMRGCDNMCTYCIVPHTRGRERSRPVSSIVKEVRQLSQQGVKEVTLLGQNVNSYRDMSEVQHYGGLPPHEHTHLSQGFSTVYKHKRGGVRFTDLLDHVSRVDPEMRVRFTSPHPKDFPDEVLQLIRERPNICRSLHLPAQSGCNEVLERMRRGYTREAYLQLVERVRHFLPGVCLSSDFICGFCGETDEQFHQTLSLIRSVQYSVAYLFPYSMRQKTTAHRRFVDDVPLAVKKQRLVQMSALFRQLVEKLNRSKIGSLELVLVEGVSKRSKQHLAGRNDGNTKVIFPATEIPESATSEATAPIKPGDYVVVMVNEASSQVLKGIPLYHTTLAQFNSSPYHHSRAGLDCSRPATALCSSGCGRSDS